MGRGARDKDEVIPATAPRAVRSVSVRPLLPTRARGASILSHVQKAKASRRSLSRAVPTLTSSHKSSTFPRLTNHYELEDKTRRTSHWVVPPKEKHALVRAWLVSRCGDGLDNADKAWLGRHRLRRENRDERKLVDEGRELYDLLVRAHGKYHVHATKTWRRVRERYVGPSKDFVAKWVRLCPTCHKRCK
ncbi:unnamed protein product [Peniophora sp. CBMAI 1063]|nr:unnamed protein product [Peniophora sp. CBMAI 1063]